LYVSCRIESLRAYERFKISERNVYFFKRLELAEIHHSAIFHITYRNLKFKNKILSKNCKNIASVDGNRILDAVGTAAHDKQEAA